MDCQRPNLIRLQTFSVWLRDLMRLFGILYCLVTLFAGQAMATDEKRVYGYIEKVMLIDQKLMISAKLDTGAKSASLNAKDIKEMTVAGKPFLRFIVPSKEGDRTFTCEYVGDVRIKVRAAEARVAPLLKKSIKRPVVQMPIQLGDKVKTIRVNLTNRKRFNYPLLLGRDALIMLNGVVDPALTYTLKKDHVDKL
jgi:hypothetical protein